MNMSDFKIKNLKGVKFGDQKIQCEIKGFSIYNKDLGYLRIGDKTDGIYNIELPYIPLGGKAVLKEILSTWSIKQLKEAKWIKSFN